ncbi:MAG TPA: AraC family transcriptional regulator [Rhizomicrobium sp.]|nr:AraC family transcriptional regulator [Rhizomicrobium sp.]
MADIAGITSGRERWSRDVRIPRHTHDAPYAAVVLSGRYEECGSRGRFHVGPGHVLLHGVFDAHLDRFSRAGAEIFNIALDRNVPFALGSVADADAIARLAEKDAHAAGAALCAHITPCESERGDWPDLLAEHLLKNPDCRLGDWAETHGLALETLSRGFGRVFGLTPAAFRAEARARRAFHRIVRDRAPLADIAAATGFADQPHMSRAVKALTGATPQTWRQSNRFKTRAAQPA